MKRFWQDLVAMLAVSAYSEIEGVNMTSARKTTNPTLDSDVELLGLQQI